MRYLALACDYDGTLAQDGHVSASTIEALERVRDSSRQLVLITGRILPDLQQTFNRLDLFDIVVAENGALLYEPARQKETLLGQPPPREFLEELRRHGVEPLSQGRIIVATSTPHEAVIEQVIRELGLDLHVILNKGAVMVLPADVSKASGLEAGLKKLGVPARNIVGIGDAENDQAFLELCECSVAVANALPELRAQVNLVTEKERGEGVVELIEELLRSDLQDRGCG